MASFPHIIARFLRGALVSCAILCANFIFSAAESAAGIDALWIDAQKNVNTAKEADILLVIADVARENGLYSDELQALKYLGRNFYERQMSPDTIMFVANRVSEMGDLYDIKSLQDYSNCLADVHSFVCYRDMEEGLEGEALKVAELFLEEALNNHDLYAHATACEILGMTYSSFGQREQALDFYREAYDICVADNGYPFYAFQLITKMCDEYIELGNTAALDSTVVKLEPLLPAFSDPFTYNRSKCAADCYMAMYEILSGQLGDAQQAIKNIKAYQTDEIGFTKMKNKVDALYAFHSGNHQAFVDIYENRPIEESTSISENYIHSLYQLGRYKDAARASEELYNRTKSRSQANYATILNQIRSKYDFDTLSKENQKNASSVSALASSLVLGAFSFIVVIAILLTVLFYIAEKDKKVIVEYQRAQTEFFKNMNHEIRTPLNAISGFAQLLTEPEMRDMISDEELEQYRKAIVDNTTLLTSMFNDIMDATDLSKDKVDITLSSVSVNELCRSAINAATQFCPVDVMMHYTSDIDDDVLIRTDKDRMLQVLLNYLTNSCKHTTSGSITLSASLEENIGKMTFAVTDTGTGVTEGMEEVIFTPFSKGDSNKQGTGMGLSICRSIAKALKGQAKVDTSYREGARFVFIHPYDKALLENGDDLSEN